MKDEENKQTKPKSRKPGEGGNRFQSDNHQMTKREPRKPFSRENDIYITNKTDFNAQYKKCMDFLNSDVAEVYLHCMGNAINRGINLVLRLQKESSVFSYEANTSTVELKDDFHPLHDEDDFTTQKRLNSCLHIRVFRNLDVQSR